METNIYCAKCKNTLNLANAVNEDYFSYKCNCDLFYWFYKNNNILLLQRVTFTLDEEDIDIWWDGQVDGSINLFDRFNNYEIYTEEYIKKYNFYSLQNNINDVVARIIKLTDNIVFI